MTLVRSMRHMHKDSSMIQNTWKQIYGHWKKWQEASKQVSPSKAFSWESSRWIYHDPAKRQTLFVDIIFPFWVVIFFKSPMLQGAVESNLFYDVTLGHLYSEQDV